MEGYIHSLKLRAKARGNGWLEYDFCFLLGPGLGLFAGAFWLVSGMVTYPPPAGTFIFLFPFGGICEFFWEGISVFLDGEFCERNFGERFFSERFEVEGLDWDLRFN